MINSLHSKAIISILVCIGLSCQLSAQQQLSRDQVLQKVVERATQNEQERKAYGYDLNMIIHWLNDEGSIRKSEVREYRTNWDDETPQLQLVSINHKQLTEKQLREEQKNREELQKTMPNGSKGQSFPSEFPFTWTELKSKYDFKMESADANAPYVIGFKPKDIDLPERCRMEKILNHLTGKIWVDDNFNILKLEGHLANKVSFGFGLAKVKQLDVVYNQKVFQGIAVPDSINLNFRVQALVFYSDRREISTSFVNYRSKSEMARELEEQSGINREAEVLPARPH